MGIQHVHKTLAIILLGTYLFGQEPTQDEGRGKADTKNAGAAARSKIVTHFEEHSPKEGEPLPQLKLLDAAGNSFPVSKFHGHYTVLVFGCLT